MSIAGVEYARRRRIYQGRPLDISMNVPPQLRRCRPGSLDQQLNSQEHHHGHRYRHKHHQGGLLQLRNNSFPEGPSVNDVGHQHHTQPAQGSTSSPAQNGVIAGIILQSEPVLRSRSPATHRGASFGSNRHGAAMAARNRLDERLRAASAVNRRRSRTSSSVNVQSDTSALWDEVEPSIQNEGEVFETSRRDWLAAWASSFHGPHLDAATLNTHSLKPKEGLSKVAIGALRREIVVPGRRGTGKEFSETTRRAGSQQEDCPVCLERFTYGQTLIRLPCRHRFHTDCLTPWLESHCHCPYCRFKVNDKMLLKTSPSTRSVNHNAIRPRDDLVSWMTAVETGLRRLGLQSTTL